MPIMLLSFFTGGWMRWAVLAFVVMAALAWERQHLINEGRQQVQVEFDKFKAEVKALGDAQIAKNKEIENGYKSKIATATDARNIALNSLRVQINSDSRPARLTPPAPTGSDQICFDPPAFAAAVERYRRSVRGLVVVGDEAQIDAQTMLNAWPK